MIGHSYLPWVVVCAAPLGLLGVRCVCCSIDLSPLWGCLSVLRLKFCNLYLALLVLFAVFVIHISRLQTKGRMKSFGSTVIP